MRDRGFSIVIGVMLALTLAGCGLEVQNLGIPAQGDNQTEGGLPATGEPEVERAAFHFRSGTLELGDFVYEDIKDNLFDPCQEISAEEFAQIGFKSTGRTQYVADTGVIGCGLTGGNVDLAYAVATSPANKEMVKNQGLLVEEEVSEVIPDAFLARGREESIYEGCVAAVDTSRGQFAAIVGEGFVEEPFDDMCRSAIQILEDLYRID